MFEIFIRYFLLNFLRKIKFDMMKDIIKTTFQEEYFYII